MRGVAQLRSGSRLVWVVLGMMVGLTGCVSTPDKPDTGPGVPKTATGKRGTAKPYVVFGKTYYPLSEQEAAGYSEEGIASWYGREFHERPTANGERFDMYKVSAAHTVLPLPILVRVTNLENGRTLDVRVNDRGPFIDNRLIDLSYAAAEELGYARRGLARVRVEALSMLAKAEPAEMYRSRPGTPPSPMPRPESSPGESPPRTAAGSDTPWKESAGGAGGGHFIQVGSFGRYENAQTVERRLQQVGKPKIIKSSVGARMMYRVRLGPFATVEQAEQMERTLRKMEIGDAVIIRD